MTFPITRYLVPEVVPDAPSGWTVIEQRILAGLPITIALSKTIQLRLGAATGLGREWVSSDPRAVISSAQWELAPHNPATASFTLQAPRALPLIQARAGSSALGGMPFRVATAWTLARNGSAAVLAEIILLDWQLCAGNFRGAGDYGSFVRLAWRPADLAVPQFGQPPMSEFVRRRTAPAQRIESKLGLLEEIRLTRFIKRREILK